MKRTMKRITPLCLIVFILMLIGGCGEKEAAVPTPSCIEGVPVLGVSEWPVLSLSPEDFGIAYDAESIEQLPEYPLDKLAAYYLGADGAFSEGASYELYQRFLDAPDIVLKYLALVGNQTVREGEKAQVLLGKALANTAAWFKPEAFDVLIRQYETLYPTGDIAEVLSLLKEQYAAAINQVN